MGKKEKPQIRVVAYFMSIHYGIAHGPLDYIRQIIIREKEAWAGEQAEYAAIDINKKELFGGIKKEGGVLGHAHYLPGGPTQTIPEVLAEKVDLTTATMPAYRGIASLWFIETGEPSQSPGGFYWTANSPFIPATWVKCARASLGLDNTIARIYRSAGTVAGQYRTTVSSTSNEFGYTFNNVDIGASDEDRQVVLLITWKNSVGHDCTPLNGTIGGLEATFHVQASTPGGQGVAIAQANVPTGTTATIFIDAAGTTLSMSNIAIAVYRVVADGPIEVDFGVGAGNSATVVATGIEVSKSGFLAVICGGQATTDIDVSYSGSETPVANSEGTLQSGRFLTWSCVTDDIATIDAGGTWESGTVAMRVAAIAFTSTEFDSNPAHIIHECLTNTEWGMGSPNSAIDMDSFGAAAQTLYDESMGLSLQWTKQLTIEAFISEILDHIEATLFINPRTGLITLKLIRDDYSLSDLAIYTPDNSVVTKFGRKLWGETINEIIVTFTNPENEEGETVVAQDLANIESQGGIVSDNRNYYGVRSKALAAELAQRDLRTAASPLASCDIETNREGWALLPGDVLILNSPEDGIESMVMRVGNVNYGKPGDPTVKASLVEDVFSLAAAEFIEPPDTITDEDEEPAPAAATYIFTLPYFMTIGEISAAILSEVDYPEVFAGVLASQAGSDSSEFELYGEIADASGGTTIGSLGTKTIAVRATLPADIDAEVETTIQSFPDRSVGPGPIAGGFMLIGEGDEVDIELCLIIAFESGGYVMRRGVLDTTPKAWPLGTPVWFIDSDLIFADSTIRSEAEVVEYQILTRTPLGLLDLDDAPVVSETLTARPHLPQRPANVKANGDNGFAGPVDLIGVNPIPVTWANRNRITEDSQILAWDAATVAGEAGQTTNVYATDIDGNVLTANTGLSGTSYNLDPADFLGEGQGYIVVKSQRDGLESLQGHRIHVLISAFSLLLETGDELLLETGDNLLLEG